MSTPWMKFYAADWRSDPGLRSCSIAARGMWMEMLCLMWEANPKGSLLIAGKRPNSKLLASLSATQVKEAETLVDELDENNVFSRDEDGTIYSRRMRRDVEKAARDKAHGSSGGNPRLKPNQSDGVKPGVNPTHSPGVKSGVGGGDNAQKPEARHNPTREGDSQGKGTGHAREGLPQRVNGSTINWDDDDHADVGGRA